MRGREGKGGRGGGREGEQERYHEIGRSISTLMSNEVRCGGRGRGEREGRRILQLISGVLFPCCINRKFMLCTMWCFTLQTMGHTNHKLPIIRNRMFKCT